MKKRLVEIDEAALAAARAELGTRTIKETVNEALRRAGRERDAEVERALDVLSSARITDREDAWR